MFPKVALGGEIFATNGTVERVPSVQSLVGLESIEGVECLVTAVDVTLEGTLFGVNSNVNFQAVRGEEGLATASLLAHKCIISRVSLLMSFQIPCRLW